ncbi:hypothetical protein, partial [uncultured Helicobacter sp.]|uniref:hypothetical protein n=1 Tax=uncultured Helicobacter sp. TaxID=175537 RepID=UPI00272C921D
CHIVWGISYSFVYLLSLYYRCKAAPPRQSLGSLSPYTALFCVLFVFLVAVWCLSTRPLV